MALTFALKGAGMADSTDASSYNYSASSLTVGEWYVIGACSSHGTAAPTITPTSSGVTFTQLGTAGGQVTPNGFRRLQAWRFQAASTSHTIALGATSSTSMDAACAYLGGVDTTTQIVQTVGTSKTASTFITTTLAAFGHTDNRPLVFVTHSTNETHTPESGFTSLYDAGHAAPVNALSMLYGTPGDVTPRVDWAGNTQSAIIAMEVKALQSGVTYGRVYQNGAWRSVTAERVYQNGAWTTVTAERAYQNGAWRSTV